MCWPKAPCLPSTRKTSCSTPWTSGTRASTAIPGLVERVRRSKIDEGSAEAQTIEFLSRFVDPRKSPMCGNSICQDRRFLYRTMPKLEAFFHYRNLDVSTVKELARRWYPDLMGNFTKQASHLALDDIRDSIAELRYYRQYFFRLPESE
jgi:oligoribonuclease